MIPHLFNNRIIAKARFPKQILKGLSDQNNNIPAEEISRSLNSGLAEQIIQKFGSSKILEVEKENDMDYILECYIFSRDEIFDLIRNVKEGNLR